MDARSLPTGVFPKTRYIPSLSPPHDINFEDGMVSGDEDDFSMQQEEDSEPEIYISGINDGHTKSQVRTPSSN